MCRSPSASDAASGAVAGGDLSWRRLCFCDVLRENMPIDAAAAAFAAATAAAAADVVASLSADRRDGAAASGFAAGVVVTKTFVVGGAFSSATAAGSTIGGGGATSGWTTGAGARGRIGPVGDFRTLGRISTIAFLGMPSFGSGPIKARSKRFGSTSFGCGRGSGRRNTSILGCTGSNRARGGGRPDRRRDLRANWRRRSVNRAAGPTFSGGRNRNARRLSRPRSGDRPLDEASQERPGKIRTEQQQECLQKQIIHE